MVQNANDILEENEEGLNESVEAIASIDIDSLSSSLRELSAILSPLAKLLGN